MGLIFKEGFSFSGYERNGVFLNREGKVFKDVSGASGADSILDGRAAVAADFDNDGDLDLFVTNIQDEGHMLYRNNIGQDNGYLRVTLVGQAGGRDAAGAIVRLKTSRGTQSLVASNGGFLAQADPRLLFGMGKDSEAEWIEIRWPSGAVQRFSGIRANQSLKFTEGNDAPQPLDEKRFNLPDPVSKEDQRWTRLVLQRGSSFESVDLKQLLPEGGVESVSLKEGRSTFINLWATWCGPCRQEMPELEKLKPLFEKNGIDLIGVTVDQDVTMDEVLAFAKNMGVSYPIFSLDSSEFDKIFRDGQLFVPLSILVDSNGRVKDVYAGWNPENEKKIHRLLEP